MVLKNIKQDNEESLVLLMPKIAAPTMFLTTGTYSKLRQNNCLFTEVKATLTFKHQSLLCCFCKERNGDFTQAFLLAFRDMVAKKVNKDNFIHLMTTTITDIICAGAPFTALDSLRLFVWKLVKI